MIWFLVFYCVFSAIVTFFMLEQKATFFAYIYLVVFSIAVGWLALPARIGRILKALE